MNSKKLNNSYCISLKDEQTFANLAKNGCKNSLDKLVLINQERIFNIAKREFDKLKLQEIIGLNSDLIKEAVNIANISLIELIPNYEIKQNQLPLTNFQSEISLDIKRYYLSQIHPLCNSSHSGNQFLYLKKGYEDYYQKFNKTPNIDDFYSFITNQEYNLKISLKFTNFIFSFLEEIYEDRIIEDKFNFGLNKQIIDENTIIEKIDIDNLNDKLKQFFSKKQLEIINLRFGLDNGLCDMQKTEVANRLSISPQYVGSVESKFKKQLKLNPQLKEILLYSQQSN